MLPCHGCAYRRDIPGDCHSSCSFKWDHDALVAFVKSAGVPPRCAHWFRFPINYDPVWGPNECPNAAATVDPKNVRMITPMEELLRMLR